MITFIFLGLISSIFQLVIFREFTFSIAKNELAFIGAVGIWLIFCALGSLIGKKRKIIPASLLPLIFSFVFCASVLAIHLIKLLFGSAYYEATSLTFVLLSGLLLIGPMSFFIGYSFANFSKEFLNRGANMAKVCSHFFGYEAIGFLIGGVSFTFFFSTYSNPFIFAFLPILLLLALPLGKVKKVFFALGIGVLSLSFIFSINTILEKEFLGSRIILNKGSHYGPIILARKNNTNSLFVSGSLISTSEDRSWVETFIHTTLSSKKDIKNVLFIGTYFSGQINEILKYKDINLDCLSINPFLNFLVRQQALSDKRERVNFIVDDPRLHIAKSNKKYDCIIMNMSAPANLAYNRYFSYEFFKLIKTHLNDKGIFSFYIPSKRDILSPNFLKFNSCLINTLDKVFKNRLLIPSDSMLIIASEQEISSDSLMMNFSLNNIKTKYLTRYHLQDYLDTSRLRYIEDSLDKKVRINTDLFPRGFIYYLALQQAKFYPDFIINIEKVKSCITVFFSIILVLVICLSLFYKKIKVLINAAVIGFSSIGIMAIIFILFQRYSGALFWKLGILIAVFMAGLSVGTFLVDAAVKRFNLNFKALSCLYIAWILFTITLLMDIRPKNNLFYIDFIFYAYSFFCGNLTGSMYPLLTKLMIKNTDKSEGVPAVIYAADLIGAFLGTFAFSMLFVPFLGVNFSLALLLVLLAAFGFRNLI